MSRTISLIVASAAIFISFRPASAVTIDTVLVGNPGNANDLSDGDAFESGVQRFGRVDYAFRIATTEVTVGQYTAFLNAVARFDTYGLYNSQMAADQSIRGILKSGSPGSYSYSVIGSPNKPVTYVSWGDAVRFANWLHNGQPIGAQGPSTTEDGAYTVDPANLSAVTRKADARWFLPSENEWYKAAYHKNDGVTGNYWDYPTSTDSLPYSDQPPGSDAPVQSNTVNYFKDDGIANGYDDGLAVTGTPSFSTSQNYLTDVGAYVLSRSPYGTFDQGGNVREWTEGLVAGGYRVHRGGSWKFDSNQIVVSDRGLFSPTTEYNANGFRVATTPEPSSLALCLLGAIGAYFLARKRHHD